MKHLNIILSVLMLIVALALNAREASNSHLTPQQQYNGRYGYVSQSGTLMIPARYDDARPFFEGLAAVEKGGRWGYINEAGRIVVKMQYGSARDFFRGYGIVSDRKTGLYGAVDRDGKLVVACEYASPEELLNAKGIAGK